MRKFAILAAVVAVAASSANCARDGADRGDTLSALNPLGPSAVSETATATSAGKGGGRRPSGGSGSSSLALVMHIDNNGDGLPNWGDTVTFNVSTTATTQPTVDLVCYQGGVAVYGASGGFYEGDPWPWTKYMALWSGAWQSGAADCTAKLKPLGGDSRSTLATLNFHVAA